MMSKEIGVTTPRVLSTRNQLPGGGLDRLADRFDLVRPATNQPSDPDELLELAAGVDAILALTPDRPGSALLAAAGPSLKVISLASMGFDGVDLAAAADRGVVVTNTPDVLAETTADLAFALILMARRRLLVAADSLRAGQWDAFRMDGYLGLDVYGSTLGLIGYGQIAKAVARRAAGFGMSVLHHTRTPAAADGLSVAVDLPTLLAQSDVVSVHVPLSPATRGLIGSRELATMKPTATLVNTARGGVVDEDALLDALERGAIASAGLDVFAKEPLGQDVSRLGAADTLVPLPHIGSATENTRATMVDVAVDNIIDVLSGLPARNPVPGTPARYDAVEVAV
jgi:glyoxylate reductase